MESTRVNTSYAELRRELRRVTASYKTESTRINLELQKVTTKVTKRRIKVLSNVAAVPDAWVLAACTIV